ncbi:MAG: glycosyltransferase [Halomonas sp.]|nr:glycosyltransferase [Halomonas sp.]MBP5980593.1 glycosyltransferase [Halomonas sp.]
MSKSLTAQAFFEFKNKNYGKSLKLYQELKETLKTNAYDYNIKKCLEKLPGLDQLPSLETCKKKSIEIKSKGLEEFVLDNLIYFSDTDLSPSTSNNLMVFIAHNFDDLNKIEAFETIKKHKSNGVKVTLLLDMQSVDLKNLTHSNEIFDEIYIRPFKASDNFWISYILNCNEFNKALIINTKEIKGASRFKVVNVQIENDHCEFVFANGSLCGYSINYTLIKEKIGFLYPFENSYAIYEFFKRLLSYSFISTFEFEKLAGCISFKEKTELSLQVLNHWIEQNLEIYSQEPFAKAVENIEKYRALPLSILGGASEIVEFYDDSSSFTSKANLFCFKEYLERAGVSDNIKKEDFLSIDKIEDFSIVTLSNYASKKQDMLSVFETDSELNYIDLLPLRSYKIVNIENLKGEAKIPIYLTVPVLKRIPKNNYNVRNWVFPDAKRKFGMISACFNNSDTVISSLISILSQSVKNIELVIVDDNSSDNSLKLISGFLSLFPYVKTKLIAKDENVGVYTCRNTAVIKSESDYLFGQDLDDFSTPQRVYISNVFYCTKEVDFLVCNHARVDSFFNILSMKKNNENLKTFRKGLMTWHTERENFFKYGLFLSVRRSGDSELFDRFKRLSKRKVFELDREFYFALMDNVNESRLTSDIFKTNVEKSPIVYKFEGDNSRVVFETNYKSNHKNLGLDYNYRFGNTFEGEKYKVIANMATIPGREYQLKCSISSLLFQVDKLNLFLNGDVDLTAFGLSDLLRNSKVNIIKSSEVGDYRDNAKFHYANEFTGKDFYLTLDDDLVYPCDYVDTLIYKSSLYNHKRVLTVHGYCLWEPLDSIHKDRKKRGRYYHFKEKVDCDVKVDVAGTGTVFIPPDVEIIPFNAPPFGMVDIVFAEYCSKNKIDIIAISRRRNWVVEAESIAISIKKEAPKLYQENQKIDRELLINKYIKKIQSNLGNKNGTNTVYRKVDPLKLHFNDKSDHLWFNEFNRKVYICCTGYNYAGFAVKFSRGLWHALRACNYDNIKILAYDDCSSDSSAEKLERYFTDNFTAWDWEVFKGDANKGPAFSRSYLFDKIPESDAICIFLDSDDEVEPELIRRILSEYICYPEILGTFGGWMFNDKIKKTWPSHIQSELTSLDNIVGKFKFGHPRSFVKSAYDKADKRFLFGPDREWLKYCSDLGLYLAILSNVCPSNFKRIDQVLYRYNVGTENGTINRFGSDKAIMRDYLFGLCRL